MQVTDEMVRVAAEAMKQRRRDEIEHGGGGATFEEQARLALTAALAAMWRPVSQPTDLPQDGMYIAANDHEHVAVIEARDGHRLVHNMPGFVEWAPVCKLTAYMLLPSPPKAEG